MNTAFNTLPLYLPHLFLFAGLRLSQFDAGQVQYLTSDASCSAILLLVLSNIWPFDEFIPNSPACVFRFSSSIIARPNPKTLLLTMGEPDCFMVGNGDDRCDAESRPTLSVAVLAP